ncbi:MAG: LamG domain-containing protein [Archangium sp.]|nr:LamG domain-containing protein [Archangium sp.]
MALEGAEPRVDADGGAIWPDRSDAGNDAQLLNAPAFDADGGSFVLDGVDDWISVPTSTSMQTPVSTMTVLLALEAPPTTDRVFLIQGYSNDTTSFTHYWYENNSLVIFYGSYTGLAEIPWSALQTGWHEVTVTYDGATVTVYVDGKPFGNAPVATTQVSTLPLSIGADFNGGYRGPSKRIGAVLMYNRALSAADVAYNSGILKRRFR